jgi:cytosine/adenosine deaminase-related metal-dependent hydrolase
LSSQFTTDLTGRMWTRLASLGLLLLASEGVKAASTLFSGGTIIAFDSRDEALRVIRDGSVLVINDRIAGVFSGDPPSGTKIPKDVERIDITGKILSPGMIDTHKHGWQTALKTLASNTTLPEYFHRYSQYVAGAIYNADDVYLSQVVGLYEALNAGTTTLVDHAHHTWSVDHAEAGLRGSIDSEARVFWAYTFAHVMDDFNVAAQISHFRKVAAKASFKGTATELGVAYDAWGAIEPDLAEIAEIMKVIE